MICAIHQPNFFPWLGYFDKIQRADIFVFMDNVAYPKTGAGTWCNRVKFNIQGTGTWISCPIRRESGVQLIKNVQMDQQQSWRKKMLRTLEMNYKKTKNYAVIMPFITSLLSEDTEFLASFNINAIKAICQLLEIPAQFVVQSELTVSGSSTELLINITKAVGANAYLCGGGASGYQEDALFAKEGIDLIYQKFVPSPYGEVTSFLPGLSVIDFLMKK